MGGNPAAAEDHRELGTVTTMEEQRHQKPILLDTRSSDPHYLGRIPRVLVRTRQAGIPRNLEVEPVVDVPRSDVLSPAVVGEANSAARRRALTATSREEADRSS